MSQNVANAGTAGYAREVVADTDLTAGGVGYGVRSGLATRETDVALQTALTDSNPPSVAGLQVRSDALASVDAAQGATGAGNDLASRLGALQDAFTTLGGDPSNEAQQAGVVTAAAHPGRRHPDAGGRLRRGAAGRAGRAGGDVTALNAAVQQHRQLSDKIIAATASGQSTADLESQRAAQEQAASQLAGLQFLPAANGDVTAARRAASW